LKSNRFIPAILFWLFTTSAAGVFTVTAENASTTELENGESLLELNGNVVVTDDQVTVTSDSAAVYQDSERAEFSGNVQVVADTLTASGAFLSYSRLTGVMVLTGNAVLSDGSSVLTADQVDWFRFRDKATAKGDVVLQGDWLGTVQGDYALYDSERKSLFVTVNPVLTRIEGTDTTVITADRLEFFQEGERAEAQGNAFVSMGSRNMETSSEYLRYFGDEERMELIGFPEIRAEEGNIRGDWMEALLETGGSIRFLRIEGAAAGDLEDQGTTMNFTSQRAEFAFLPSGEELDSLLLQGGAILNVAGEDSLRAEANTINAEEIVIRFFSGEADEIMARGYVRGTYSWSGEFRD
jgi:lipopolysaccharide export system protein LptA